jgi:hypothetical protein
MLVHSPIPPLQRSRPEADRSTIAHTRNSTRATSRQASGLQQASVSPRTDARRRLTLDEDRESRNPW